MNNITYKDFNNISNILITSHFSCLIIICFQSILSENERILFTIFNIFIMLFILLFKNEITGFNKQEDKCMSLTSMLYITCTFITFSSIVLTSFFFVLIS